MMSQEQTQRAAERLAAKRAAVLGPRRKKRRLVVPLAAAGLVLAAAALLVGRLLPEAEAEPAAGAMFHYVPRSGEVAYRLADLAGPSARFYQHKAEGGVIVRYFLHRGADGAVHGALDACGECWREGKGHRQEGGEMVCAHCGKRFALGEPAGRADPCAPIALPVTVRGEHAAVAVPDLLEAAKYFQKPYRSL